MCSDLPANGAGEEEGSREEVFSDGSGHPLPFGHDAAYRTAARRDGDQRRRRDARVSQQRSRHSNGMPICVELPVMF